MHPYLLDLIPELHRVDEEEGVFLGQQRRRKRHGVVQNVAATNVEQPRYLVLRRNGSACREVVPLLAEHERKSSFSNDATVGAHG